MKLCLDYKRLFNTIILAIFILMPVAFSSAQTISDLQNKISQKDSDITKLEEEIKVYQTELDSLEKQKSSLSGSIKQLDITRKKLNADISVTQKKIDKTNLKIESLSGEIGNKESTIGNNIESIKLGIQKTNELELDNALEIILSSDDFTEMWNDIDNMATVHEKIREEIIMVLDGEYIHLTGN